MRPPESNDSLEATLARISLRSNIRMRLRNEAMGIKAKVKESENSMTDISEQIYQSVQAQLRILRMWNPETPVSAAMDSLWDGEAKLSNVLNSADDTNQRVGFAGMTFAEFLSHTGLREEFKKHNDFANKYIRDAGTDDPR